MERARRKGAGGEGVEEGWMNWKRGRGGETFEGCEALKSGIGGVTDRGKPQDGARKGWERGI